MDFLRLFIKLQKQKEKDKFQFVPLHGIVVMGAKPLVVFSSC